MRITHALGEGVSDIVVFDPFVLDGELPCAREDSGNFRVGLVEGGLLRAVHDDINNEIFG